MAIACFEFTGPNLCMKTISVAFLLSLLVSLLVAPVVLYVARRYNLHDNSNDERKIHHRKIPRLGGIAIAAGFFAPVVGLAFWDNYVSAEVFSDTLRLGGIVLLALIVFFVGLAEDLRGLAARWRFFAHLTVGAAAWAIGFRIETVAALGIEFSFPPLLSVAFTMLWFALVINAINLIDGLDGLAGGIVFIVTIGVFALALLKGATFMSLMTAALAGSLLGFLFYNFAPARIFMGDGGSYFLGFTIAALTLDASLKSSTVTMLGVPFLALGVPIFDTIYAFMRRALRGIPIARADKRHIHHRLREMGFNSRQVVALLYMLTAFGCAVPLTGVLKSDSMATAVVLVVSVASVMAVKLCGGRGICNLARHIADRYRQRRARFAAYESLISALSQNRPPEEVYSRLVNFAITEKCCGVRLAIRWRDGEPNIFSWRVSEDDEHAHSRLSHPFGGNGTVRGEVEFSLPEALSDVFSRDKEYFRSISWNLGRWIGGATRRHLERRPAQSPKIEGVRG
ncbi:MAG: hypothetical protein Kow00107_07560 [Planctomycetota bacterium]